MSKGGCTRLLVHIPECFSLVMWRAAMLHVEPPSPYNCQREADELQMPWGATQCGISCVLNFR